jgi:hypothetical protein
MSTLSSDKEAVDSQPTGLATCSMENQGSFLSIARVKIAGNEDLARPPN